MNYGNGGAEGAPGGTGGSGGNGGSSDWGGGIIVLAIFVLGLFKLFEMVFK